MSHFSQIKTQMNNERAIVAALEEMGYEVQVHEKATRMHSPYREARMQKMKAHIITKAEGGDFGLVRTQDGTYEAIGDTMYRSVAQLVNALPIRYAKQVILQQAQELGDEYTVVENIVNGQLQGYTITVDKVPQLAIGQSSITSNQVLVGGSY